MFLKNLFFFRNQKNVIIISCGLLWQYTVLKSQKAVTAYLKIKQLVPFDLDHRVRVWHLTLAISRFIVTVARQRFADFLGSYKFTTSALVHPSTCLPLWCDT